MSIENELKKLDTEQTTDVVYVDLGSVSIADVCSILNYVIEVSPPG